MEEKKPGALSARGEVGDRNSMEAPMTAWGTASGHYFRVTDDTGVDGNNPVYRS